MGFIKSLFKDHLRTDRKLLHGADKLRRDLFHPKEDKPAEASEASMARVGTVATGCAAANFGHSPICFEVAETVTCGRRQGLASFPDGWRNPGFDWSSLHC